MNIFRNSGLVLALVGMGALGAGPTPSQFQKLTKTLHPLRIRNETGKQLNLEVRVPCLRGGGCATQKVLAFTIADHYDEQKFDVVEQLVEKNGKDKDFWIDSEICFKDFYAESSLFWGWLYSLYIPRSALSIRVVDPSLTICRTFSCDSSSSAEVACRMTNCEPVDGFYVDTGFVEAGSGQHVVKILQGTLRVLNRGHVLAPIKVTKN